jgi:RHS repeat-associated protein
LATCRTTTRPIYNYFRDYDPQVGRYAESDPIGLAVTSYSTFAYAGGNPVGDVDPLGLFTQQQLQNIIYNETASLSGPGIDAGSVAIAYVLQNRSNAGINGGVASDALTQSAQSAIQNGVPAAVAAYNRAAAAAAKAIDCPSNDPTGGALHFNLRGNASVGPWLGLPAYPMLLQFGPLNSKRPDPAALPA